MESLDTLASRLDDDDSAVQAALNGVSASRSIVAELLDSFADLGIDGGQTVAALRESDDRLEKVTQQLAVMADKVCQARVLVTGSMHGPDTSAPSDGAVQLKSGDAVDDPAAWSKPASGEELLERSKESSESRGSRMSRLGKVAARNYDEVNDKSKQTTDQAVESYKAFRKLPDGPTETASGTSTPPVAIDQPQGTTPSIGDVTSAGVTLAIGSVIVYQKITKRGRR